MNFLCHALPYLNQHQPLMLAGTAVPDWLSVVDRKVRARSRLAEPFLEVDDEALRLVARGIVQHHHDDHWFHNTRAFAELNLQFALELRDLLPGDEGFRPTFVGHILIEMILDGLWIADDRTWGERYYGSLMNVDPRMVERCVSQITQRSVAKLPEVIERFVAARFLFDYLQSDTLLWRLNQVMQRIGLGDLPDRVLQWLPCAISQVTLRRVELLTPADSPSPFPLETFKNTRLT